jgi:hypothetical protein
LPVRTLILEDSRRGVGFLNVQTLHTTAIVVNEHERLYLRTGVAPRPHDGRETSAEKQDGRRLGHSHSTGSQLERLFLATFEPTAASKWSVVFIALLVALSAEVSQNIKLGSLL